MMAEAIFVLTLRNPCIDPDYITILKLPIFREMYTLFDEMEWAYPTNTYETRPIGHSLCGGLSNSVIFIDESLTLDSAPISYDISENRSKMYSEDFSLLGEHTLTYRAHLTDYPSMQSEPSNCII